MENLGVCGKILEWIKSWLTNRKQRTVLNGCCSELSYVISGVPQGSVLGPLLFVIFISDLDDCTKSISIMLKFADDTKLGNISVTEEDRENLQTTINDLLSWSDKWCMLFNVPKCKVLHVGRNNPTFEYKMNGEPLATVTHERDIGIIIDDTLKPSEQCSEAARRATTVLSQISRVFMYRDKRTFLQLYKQFVRCHLEFAVQAWSPWLIGDIELLERVQRREI